MNQNEMRKIALGAVRSQARQQGQNPADLTFKPSVIVPGIDTELPGQ